MIKVLIGDIFDSKAQTLVNTVNCVGVMGKGLALEYKRRFPDMYKDYLDRCARNEVCLGEPYLYKSVVSPWILNFPTKDHWRSLANVKDIIKGLEYLLVHYKEWGITSIAVPPLGSGLGQLEWRIVGPTLFKYLIRMDVLVELYAPYGTPTDELEQSFLMSSEFPKQLPLRTPDPEWIVPAWVALVEILKRIEDQPHHWPIGRTTFQKMAYIANEEGLPLGLEFQKSSYGPFSPDLKKMVSRLINNGLISENREGRMFRVRVGPTYEQALDTYSSEIGKWEQLMKKVANLFIRVNTKRAEVIATVVFVAKDLERAKDHKPTEMEVLNAIMEWKVRRRPPLEKEEVAATVRSLAAFNWLDIISSEDLPLPQFLSMDV